MAPGRRDCKTREIQLVCSLSGAAEPAQAASVKGGAAWSVKDSKVWKWGSWTGRGTSFFMQGVLNLPIVSQGLSLKPLEQTTTAMRSADES